MNPATAGRVLGNRRIAKRGPLHWAAPPIEMAEIPLRIVNGHYLIDITLDGKRLVAMVDARSPHSSIGLAEAERYFGLSPVSPDML
ncbi:MAG TPA: hypothetical protein VNY75_10110, partial [Rhizomicrobium sp.]|nr:hypothetical protein [Rhizomicrobium sp.]